MSFDRGITPDLQSGEMGRVYEALGIGQSGAPKATRTFMHLLGFPGGPFPVRAPAGDRSLRKTPAELQYFTPKGLARGRATSAAVTLERRAGSDALYLTRGADGDSNDKGGPCRLIHMLADFRLTWMLKITDSAHPHYLDLSKLEAARAYVLRLSMMELEPWTMEALLTIVAHTIAISSSSE